MTETKLLDKTLELIDANGTLEAYNYLKENLNGKEEWSSQVYNFLYCLAATSDQLDEAIDWLKKAIIEKDLWYRPEVFEDGDLDVIRDSEDFQYCRELSIKRYEKALENVTTEFSWTEKTVDNLIVVLHGNQQNNMISKELWKAVKHSEYQIEFLQSSEIDSCGLFRWNTDGNGSKQLCTALNSIPYESYKSRILFGFSAGCNTIFRTILDGKIDADKVVLLSPWMPIINDFPLEIINVLKHNDIEVVIICGLSDEDCLQHCKTFESMAKELKFDCTLKYIEGMGHEYPDNFSKVISELL